MVKNDHVAGVQDLLYFVRERENIRRAREAGESPPWTKDWILQTYRFCNIRRKDDRVSKWIIEHVLKHCPTDGRSLQYFLEQVTLCRFVNWPPTLTVLWFSGVLKEPIDWKGVGKLLEKRRAVGDKVWTGAYMIKGKPEGKGKYIARVLGKSFKEHGAAIVEAVASNSCQATHEAFMKLGECGSFLAGQIVADLTYTPLLRNATDLYTWAPMGPGSRRGYNRLKGLDLYNRPNEQEFISQLQTWRKEIVDKLGTPYADMTLHDVQNCVCEIDKWLRVKQGEGRPRSKYVPETAF